MSRKKGARATLGRAPRAPWLCAMRRLREDIQRYQGDIVRDTLDILTGRTVTLEEWFKR